MGCVWGVAGDGAAEDVPLEEEDEEVVAVEEEEEEVRGLNSRRR